MPVAPTVPLEAREKETLAVLRHALDELQPAVLATAFGPESMVMIDLAARHRLRPTIVSVDTGRLPQETHALIEDVRARYGMAVELLHPDAGALGQWTGVHGTNAFYRSTALRRECCRVRKIDPLRQALAGKRAWITGLRRDQGPSRSDAETCSWDAGYGLYKVNPMLEWTREEVWAYIKGRGVPYNALHDQGYPSIGCAPCSRPVAAGESERDGRWWWERDQAKECGLHFDPVSGRLVRTRRTGTQ